MGINYEVALSTSDNPYNPLEDYDSWEQYDRLHNYGTSDYLARVTRTSHEFGEAAYAEDIERTIDEIVLLNLISWTHEGISYIKVTKEIKDSDIISENEE